MKKSVKILSALLALVLVFACGIGATLAYLQKESGEVINTFAAKDITKNPSDFVLKEHNVVRDEQTGKYDYVDEKGPDTEVTQVAYDRVVPGATLPKDPFVRVKNQENAYLFLEVSNELPEGMTYQIDTTRWIEMENVKTEHFADSEKTTLYVYKPAEIGMNNEYVLKAMADEDIAKVLPVFVADHQQIDVSTTFAPAGTGTTGSLKFFAYLGQATNFDTYQAAWDTMFATK